MPEIADAAKRPRGRPRLTIDRDAVADAVAELFAEGGYEAVSIIDTADRMGVSRATLYRTIPTKEDLVDILFERSTRALTEGIKAAIASSDDLGERLTAVIAFQAEAAVSMRGYLEVVFGGAGLPPGVHSRWQAWNRRFEKTWAGVVGDNMASGLLREGNPTVTGRLILGMIIGVSRWYRPREKITAREIADTALRLVRCDSLPDGVGVEVGERVRGRRTRATGR